MNNLKPITQYGEKSIYVEKSTGNIHIHSPNGEIRIISPATEKGIKQLLREIGDQREVLNEILIAISTGDIPHALTDPPFSPEDFFGRDEDLNNLRNRVMNGDNFLLLVNGHGGIGKTTLAARYYHTFKDEYKHVGWILSEKNLASALLYLRNTLRFTEEQNKLLQEEQLRLMITKLANLKKPSLLVIDNVNEIADLEQNYLALRKCSNFHLLLTTRINEFGSAPMFKVDGLSEPYAMALFQKHYPKHKEVDDNLLKEVIQNVDRNTLIIELLAKNMAELNKLIPVYSLEQLVEDIHISLVKLSKSKEIYTSYHANSHKLRVERPEDIVMAMYDFTSLSDGEKRMLSVFSVLPGEAIPYEFLKQIFTDEDISTHLLSIAKKGWVDFNENEKLFKANQVVRDVAFEKQKEQVFEDCKTFIQKLGNQLAGDDILHHEQFHITTQLVGYADSILDKLDETNETMAVLCQSLGDYHSNTGEVTLSLTVYKKMSTVFKALHEADIDTVDFKNGLAISYEKLGQTHTAMGNLDKALTYFEDQTRLFKELYEAYPQTVDFKNGLAISYSKLGVFFRDQMNDKTILTYFEDRSQLGKELYEAYPQTVAFKNGLAISYAKLGVFFRDHMNDKTIALDNFKKANKLWTEMIRTSPQNSTFIKYSGSIKKDIDDISER